MKIDHSLTPQIKQDLLTRSVEGELLVFDNEETEIHQLNLSASFIFNKCNGTLSIDSIAQSLADEFDISLDKALQDVLIAVRSFADKGLLLED